MLLLIVCLSVTVCVQGLEAQLLGIVVCKERPELEAQMDSLVISIASGKKSLQELEDEILRLLSRLFHKLSPFTFFIHILSHIVNIQMKVLCCRFSVLNLNIFGCM